MKYTVVVKTITSSNGDFKRKRYNNVSKKIVNYLLKNRFSFKVGISNNIVNRQSAERYIEIYTKSPLLIAPENYKVAFANRAVNEKLFRKLKHLSKKKGTK